MILTNPDFMLYWLELNNQFKEMAGKVSAPK